MPGQENSDDKNFVHPGINSSVLDKGHFETGLFAFYGTFYKNAPTKEESNLVSQKQHIIGLSPSFYYGIWNWLNVGVTYQFMHVENTMLFEQSPFTSTYTVNSIGPQVRIKLFDTDESEIYLQARMLIPLDDYIPAEKITYSSHLIASRWFGNSWVLSLQFGGVILPEYNDKKHPVIMPASLFTGFLVNSNLMIFAILNHSTYFGSSDYADDNKYYRLNYTTDLGPGVRYQLFRNMDISGYYIFTLHSKYSDKFNSLSVSIISRF